ncbi:UDP-N-acetylmuramoyl-tripeptide--D-alanyl-D-alanine ligase [Sedimenticola hydrogenitrophicus]|uniref:UDP-N-acetylmuramoyl-tripeptide--D-alanyl-D- alanine ligase n=1 Tax=Sedimenticola hydrogenitrophicus TaxID=2967975 RepID=UPI0023B1F05C|nr:UDP-N-acetylmuramoyl-tripeptide--D-alanyl-D-alanine ligase [Sedimenticola hydrogenitrophicus]
MIAFTLAEMAGAIRARQLGGDARFSAVSTDTRRLQAGDLFVALKGSNFDGHDYLPQALAQGAVAVVVDHELAVDCPQLVVEDTRVALGRMAAEWRLKSKAQVIAVTGSNGKTTVKEMIAAILSGNGTVLATRGNLNNDIGMPLTLLQLQDEDFAVIEMGANHPGEIGYLSKIARPDVALLNNACRSHLEGFGTLEGVAKAKSEIVSGLVEPGCFVFNADDRFAPFWRGVATGRRVCSFGIDQPADISSPGQLVLHWYEEGHEQGFSSRFAVDIPGGSLNIELALAGEHNRMNALAAIAAALQVGASEQSIVAGLAAIRPVKGRLQPLRGQRGIWLIDDSYNANPDSVGAAIDVLAQAPGRRFLLLGELGELGAGTLGFYGELGRQARAAGIEHLYAVGEAGEAARQFAAGGAAFASRDSLLEQLQHELRSGDRVLVKGSRRAAMEMVVNALVERETD